VPPKRRRTPLGFAPTGLALCLFVLPPAAGCKSTTGESQTTRPGRGGKRAPDGAKLPKPLELPADAPAFAYLADPAAGLERLQALSPETLSLEVLVEQELGRHTSEALASAIAKAADPTRPWSGVELEGGEGLGHLPLRPDALAELEAQLTGLPQAGDFGALSLPAAEGQSPWLGWLQKGENGAWFTFGSSERAVVSGDALHQSYGGKGFNAALDLSRLPIEGERPPVERIWVSGELHDLTAKARFVPDFDPTKELPIEAGAMSELLGDASILLGASSRYRDYEKAVSNLISELQGQIDGLPFLIKGFASDLAARFNAIARSWNGRFALAFADGHVRVAYGANDPKKAGVAVLHFLRGAVDGISLARNFSSDVPDMQLKKNAQRAGEIAIHRLTLRNLQGVPKEARPLLDDRRNLHIAMAFDAKLGGGVLAVGPESVAGLKTWIERSEAVSPLADAPEGSLRFALSPQQLQRLARGAEAEFDMSELWSWKAEGPPYTVDLRRVDERHWSARIQGPAEIQRASIVAPIKAAEAPQQ
jgi:prepilin-type processing-associated H-X9-DG protein